jgi:GT2 family glycosyltransferase
MSADVLPTLMIAVITRKRPEQLGRLLAVLGNSYGTTREVSIGITDNDPEGSSRGLVDSYATRFAGDVRYSVEPNVGYASARNRVVSLLSPSDEFLVFVDDDEYPDPGWLKALVETAVRFDADVVAGPVVTEFPEAAPQVIVDSGIFAAQLGRQHSWGQSMRWCASNNTLVHRSVFERVPDGFSSRFDRAGGEDSHFFLRASQAGCKIVWAPEAIVREVADPSRMQPRWHLDRARHVGWTWVTIDRELRRSPQVLLRHVAAAGYRAGKGLALVIAGLSRGSAETRLRGKYQLALVRGMIDGLR